MAERLYFYIKNKKVFCTNATFDWYSGFSVSQKQKSIDSFHDAIRSRGRNPLEISTKSPDNLGKKLSAFNLHLDGYTLECVFQSSKVFQKGGPYADILEKTPKEAKRDERLTTSGALKAFQYQGEEFPLLPKTLFYDFIYYNAVRETISESELRELCEYNAFTDIEFNANKSINTQARSVALVVLIFQEYQELPKLSKEEFLELHKEFVKD